MAQQKKIMNHIKADHILKNFWKDTSEDHKAGVCDFRITAQESKTGFQ